MEEESQFEIIIDFEKGGNPNRVFKSMTEIIDSFQTLDSTLSEVVGLKVENSLILEGIEKGSLKTIIRNLLQDLPDEDLRGANFKRIIGYYLVRTKYAVLRWSEETPKLVSPDQVSALERELIGIAEELEINQIPAYRPPDRVKLLTNISSIQKATNYLSENDSVYFVCKEGTSKVSGGIEISDKIVEDVLTKEVLVGRSTAILKVKKPDYLGTSKWALKLEGHAVDISITDQDWLQKFQNKEVSVQPGDSIRGTLVRFVSYGHNSDVIGIRYELDSVDEVIEAQGFGQSNFETF